MFHKDFSYIIYNLTSCFCFFLLFYQRTDASKRRNPQLDVYVIKFICLFSRYTNVSARATSLSSPSRTLYTCRRFIFSYFFFFIRRVRSKIYSLARNARIFCVNEFIVVCGTVHRLVYRVYIKIV